MNMGYTMIDSAVSVAGTVTWKRLVSEDPGNGERFVGVQARATIPVRVGTTLSFHLLSLTSAGLWGIEEDSGEDYFQEVYAEEREQLAGELVELARMIVGGTCDPFAEDN